MQIDSLSSDVRGRRGTATAAPATLTRERAWALIQREPGLHLHALAEKLGVGVATADHHVARLQEEGRVESMMVGRMRLLFPRELAHAQRELARHVALLRDPATRRLAEAVVASPGVSRIGLAVALPDSARSVYHNLKKLRDEGLITTDPPRRYDRVLPTPALARALAAAHAG